MNRAQKNILGTILMGTGVFLIFKYTEFPDWLMNFISTPASASTETGSRTPLSRLYQYYKERLLGGDVSEDGGAQMRDIGKALATYGVCSENLWPYDILKFADAPTAAADADAANNKIKSYHAVTSLDEIRQTISITRQPVMMGIDIYESFESEVVTKTGIVPIPVAGEKLLGGHAVLAVGYDDDKGWLKCRNSWGKGWGDKGHFYLPYKYFAADYVYDCWSLQK